MCEVWHIYTCPIACNQENGLASTQRLLCHWDLSIYQYVNIWIWMYPKEYINVQWWGVFSLFTTCQAFANHNRSSLDLFWFNLCRLGTLIDFSGLWVVLKSFKWCHLVFWNLPSLAEDEQVIEDIRISGFEKSARNPWSAQMADWECTYIFMPLEQSAMKNIVVSDSAVTEHDHKQKSPVWNFLSDQQTAWIRFPKTRLRHRSWPPMNLRRRGFKSLFVFVHDPRLHFSTSSSICCVQLTPHCRCWRQNKERWLNGLLWPTMTRL